MYTHIYNSKNSLKPTQRGQSHKDADAISIKGAKQLDKTTKRPTQQDKVIKEPKHQDAKPTGAKTPCQTSKGPTTKLSNLMGQNTMPSHKEGKAVRESHKGPKTAEQSHKTTKKTRLNNSNRPIHQAISIKGAKQQGSATSGPKLHAKPHRAETTNQSH